MEEVIRVLNGKRQREMKRRKISDLTPQQLFNNMNYHKGQTRPHKILRHQYQHLNTRPYNNIDHLTDQKIYPLSYVFAYQPLRANQMEQERGKSKSISQDHSFLRDYDPVKYQKSKEEYMNRIKMKEQLQKQIQEEQEQEYRDSRENDFSSDLTSDLVPHRETTMFSRVSRYSRVTQKTRLTKSFRAAAIAVFFTKLLHHRLKKYIFRRKQKCLQNGKMFVQQASLTMQTHYFNLLQKEITQYILLLQKIHRYPSYNTDNDVLKILSLMTQKLNSSTIPKSLLQCLQLIAVNYSYINFPFLFHSQITRLELDEQWGCLVQIGKEQSFLISGVLMGITMLCYNLLYRPWLASNLFVKKQKRHFVVQNYYDKLKKSIHNIGSIIYFLVIDHFLQPIQEIQTSYHQLQQIMDNCGIQLVGSLKVDPKYPNRKPMFVDINKDSDAEDDTVEDQATTVKSRKSDRLNSDFKDKAGIIMDQNRRYYQEMKMKYPAEIQIISMNLRQWISKSTLSALSEVNRARVERVYKFVGKIKRSPY